MNNRFNDNWNEYGKELKKQNKILQSDLLGSKTMSTETVKLHNEIREDCVKDDGPGSFILNRFFNEEQRDLNIVSTVPKPKPRKNITKIHTPSLSSNGTFNVTSPIVLKKEEIITTNDHSDSSVKTRNNYVASSKSEKSKVVSVIIHNAPQIHLDKPDTSRQKEDQNKDKALSRDTKSLRTIERDSKTKKVSNVMSNDPKEVENIPEEVVFTYERISEIIIHRTDKLLLNSLVIHPVVKLHIVDVNTGRYFPKSNKSRPVVFYYEQEECDYMSPVMTKPYSLQEYRTLYPSWEEPILLNEDFEYIRKESANIIMFFEIIDFLCPSAMKTHSITNGWHKIAFAFLKLADPNNGHNLQKKLRLQLYYLDLNDKCAEPHQCSIWKIWKKRKLQKYPSTLYVSVRSVISPTKIVDTFRSKTPIQDEKSVCRLADEDTSCDETSKKLNVRTISKCKDLEAKENYTNISKDNLKRDSDVFRLPNNILAKLPSYDEGCFVTRFSNKGSYLACAVLQDTIYTIVIYSVELVEEVQKFPSHKGLIYDIDWSQDDTLLIAASADCTISVWNLKSSTFLQILPHPSFVYTCKIDQEYVVAAGCYDKIIRLWIPHDNGKFNLAQELECHAGYITSLVFNKKSSLLYSSDSVGSILEWSKQEDSWKLNRDISILDLKHTVINELLLFCKERRMLIHSRDSTLRIVDLKNICVLHWLQGSLNRRVQTFCSLSHCETFIICGSENGIINVWSTRNGIQVASYVPYSQDYPPIHCVQFHPYENVLSISHYGSNLPILLYNFDQNIPKQQVGLKVINDDIYQAHINGKTTNPKLTERRKSIKEDKKFDFKSILDKMDEIVKPLSQNSN